MEHKWQASRRQWTVEKYSAALLLSVVDFISETDATVVTLLWCSPDYYERQLGSMYDCG